MSHQLYFIESFVALYILTEKKGEIDKLAEEYIANVRSLASEQRVEHLQKIQNAYSKCKEYSDDKVQLAMQTYEMASVVLSCCSCPWYRIMVITLLLIYFYVQFSYIT